MKIYTVALYKLKMMLKDRLFMGAMILIPLFIILAAGYSLKYEKLDKIPVAIADEDDTDYSRLIFERMSKKEGLQVEKATRDQAMEMLEKNKVEAAFIIKKDFKENILKGQNKEIIYMVNSPASFSYNLVSEAFAGEVMRLTANNLAVNEVIRHYKKFNKDVGEGLYKEVEQYADSYWAPEPLLTINYQEMNGTKIENVERVSVPTSTYFSVGIILVFLMFYILFGSGWLIDEKSNGTIKRLTLGPNGLIYSFAGSIIALLLSGMLQVILFEILLKAFFGVNLLANPLSYIIVALYLTSVISICMLFSAVLKTSEQLQAIAPGFTLLTGFAGGCFWNITSISSEIRFISKFTPQGWALEGINKLMEGATTFASIATPMLVLAAIPLILLPISYQMIKDYCTK